ncbi:sensor histidine kinase [Jatrophihabitans fulvus]
MRTHGWRRGAVVTTALATLIVSLVDLQQHHHAMAGVGLAAAVASAAAVLLTQWRPEAAAALVVVMTTLTASTVAPLTAGEPFPWPARSVQALVAVLVCLGLGPAPRVLALRPLLAATTLVAQVAALAVMSMRTHGVDWNDLVPATLFAAAACGVADLLASRRRVGGELVRQRAATASEQQARLLAEERARIARELHDVVAHHLSVVVVRADSAPVRLPGVDARVAAEFAAVADDARASLEQMRRVLLLLRDETDPSGAAPQPTLADVAGLVADARAAGADIRLDGPGCDVGGVAGLVAYRTVQEAVTNALRHAPGAPVDVHVGHEADDLVVRVENPADARPLEEGHGLRGMRERVSGAGGTVTAGYTDSGTFAVRAEIPDAR